jgi:hypothetical protein
MPRLGFASNHGPEGRQPLGRQTGESDGAENQAGQQGEVRDDRDNAVKLGRDMEGHGTGPFYCAPQHICAAKFVFKGLKRRALGDYQYVHIDKQSSDILFRWCNAKI